MDRDRNVIAALGCALTLLVALVVGLSQHPSTTTPRREGSVARSKAVPQLLVAVAARTIRARQAPSSLLPDCDRRAPAEHGHGGSSPDALPAFDASLELLEFSEAASPLGRGAARTVHPRVALSRREARAPPV